VPKGECGEAAISPFVTLADRRPSLRGFVHRNDMNDGEAGHALPPAAKPLGERRSR